jgi:ABC-2 type transport system permease protein
MTTRVLPISKMRAEVEVKSLVRDRHRMVFTFFFPMLLLLIFGTVFNHDVVPGVSFSQYFTAGIIASGIVYAAFENLAISIPLERDNGTLKRLRGTPMPLASYFVGKGAQVALCYVAQVVLLIGLGVALFGVSLPTSPVQWLTFVWVSVLGLACCTLLGIAFSAVPKHAESAPAIVTPIVLIAQFISGVFIAFNDLPHWMQLIASFFPLKWLCEAMRSVFLSSKASSLQPHGSYQLGWCALVLIAWTIAGGFLAWRNFSFSSDR